MKIISHLNSLESAGLVRVAQVSPELEYIFRHTLIQEAAYASLPLLDQQRLHQAVGEAIEHLYPDELEDMAIILARHFELAGEPLRALNYYPRAGKTALDSYANQEAESHYRSALRLASEIDVPAGERADLCAGLGEALYQQGRFEEAIQSWQDGITAYQIQRDHEGIARLYARCARAAWFNGDTPGGLLFCQRGLEAVAGAPEGPGIALLVHETARAYHFNGMPDQALMLCQRALEMAKRLDAVEVEADALTTLGILPTISAQEAMEALTKAVDLARSAGLLNIASRAYINLGSLKQSALGKPLDAIQDFLQAAEFARKRGAVQEEVFSKIGAISIMLELGEVKKVEEQEIPAIEAAIQTLPRSTNLELNLSILKAVMTGFKGDLPKAIDILVALQEKARQRGDLQILTSAVTVQVTFTIELDSWQKIDDWSGAEAALQEALSLSERGMGGRTRPLGQLSVVRSRQGRLAEARTQLEAMRQSLGNPTIIWDRLFLAEAETELAKAEGNWSKTLGLYEELAAMANQLSLNWYRALLLIHWADACLARGEPGDLERAQSLYREAQVMFERFQVAPQLNLIRSRLKELRQAAFDQATAQQKVARELAQAGRIQESFLPTNPPQLPGWQIAVTIRPARQTSGDYYDFIPLSGGQMGIVIADVADKGIAAALYMASSRTLIRAYASEHPDRPEQAIEAVNRRLLMDTHGGLFVTVFYGVLDPASGKLTYCNAGHNPPYLLSRSDTKTDLPNQVSEAEKTARNVQALTRTGVAVGIFEDARWENRQAQIDPGGLLALYTDGITEAQNAQEQSFGAERLIRSMQAQAGRGDAPGGAAAIRDAMLNDLWQFCAQSPQLDDITLMVLLRETAS